MIIRSVHARSRASLAAHLSRLQELVTQQQIRGNAGARRNGIPQDTERVEDTLEDGVHGLAGGQVQSDDSAFALLVLESGHYFVWVSTILYILQQMKGFIMASLLENLQAS